MTKDEVVFGLKAIIAKLEAHRALIAEWIVHDDPELMLLGQYQKQIVDRYHKMLVELVEAAQGDDADGERRLVPAE